MTEEYMFTENDFSDLNILDIDEYILLRNDEKLKYISSLVGYYFLLKDNIEYSSEKTFGFSIEYRFFVYELDKVKEVIAQDYMNYISNALKGINTKTPYNFTDPNNIQMTKSDITQQDTDNQTTTMIKTLQSTTILLRTIMVLGSTSDYTNIIFVFDNCTDNETRDKVINLVVNNYIVKKV